MGAEKPDSKSTFAVAAPRVRPPTKVETSTDPDAISSTDDGKFYSANLKMDAQGINVLGDGKKNSLENAILVGESLRITFQQPDAAPTAPQVSLEKLVDLLKGIPDLSFSVEITCVG